MKVESAYDVVAIVYFRKVVCHVRVFEQFTV